MCSSLLLLLPFLKLATSAYEDWLQRAIVCIDSNVGDLVKGVLTRHHPSEYSVLEFQVRAVVDSDEKPVVDLSAWIVQCRRSRKREVCVLTAVCVLSSIGGTQQSCRINVVPSQVLVLILSTVYTGHARAIALINVTALDHELLDHTMERRVGVRHAVVLGRTQLAETTWLLSASSALVPRTPYLLPYFSHVFGAWSV